MWQMVGQQLRPLGGTRGVSTEIFENVFNHGLREYQLKRGENGSKSIEISVTSWLRSSRVSEHIALKWEPRLGTRVGESQNAER